MENVRQPMVLTKFMNWKNSPGMIRNWIFVIYLSKARQNKTNWTKDKTNVWKNLGGAPCFLENKRIQIITFLVDFSYYRRIYWNFAIYQVNITVFL